MGQLCDLYLYIYIYICERLDLVGRHMRRRAAGDTCEQSPELDAPYVQLPKANLAPLVVRTDDRHVVGGLGAFWGGGGGV